jgi:hypothetical protein
MVLRSLFNLAPLTAGYGLAATTTPFFSFLDTIALVDVSRREIGDIGQLCERANKGERERTSAENRLKERRLGAWGGKDREESY